MNRAEGLEYPRDLTPEPKKVTWDDVRELVWAQERAKRKESPESDRRAETQIEKETRLAGILIRFSEREKEDDYGYAEYPS